MAARARNRVHYRLIMSVRLDDWLCHRLLLHESCQLRASVSGLAHERAERTRATHVPVFVRLATALATINSVVGVYETYVEVWHWREAEPRLPVDPGAMSGSGTFRKCRLRRVRAAYGSKADIG
jgi:hypothetical protein